MGRHAACIIALCIASAVQESHADSYACQALACSTLIPESRIDDPATNDCGYRKGNLWWLDHVAGSLAWGEGHVPITVAIFDDGAYLDHEDLRDQLWTNSAEAAGRPGLDDDHNGFVDDLHGWDFVDHDATVEPQGACVGRPNHGTFMASLIAARRNNGAGIAAAGSNGARVMVLRIVGCGGAAMRVDPSRVTQALDYAVRQGAKILSFSAHWSRTSPQLDAAFETIAGSAKAEHAAIVVASVPNKGEATAGYPAAYRLPRIVRAVPIGNDDIISPGTSPAPPGLNFGAPSACVLGASGSQGYAIRQGSSNSTAILAGVLAGIWSHPRYARFSADQFLEQVVQAQMSRTERRSKPWLRGTEPDGVPLADACTLATQQRTASVCTTRGQ
jgi:subtilisin family serine protease